MARIEPCTIRNNRHLLRKFLIKKFEQLMRQHFSLVGKKTGFQSHSLRHSREYAVLSLWLLSLIIEIPKRITDPLSCLTGLPLSRMREVIEFFRIWRTQIPR